jgi:PKHD-type hydroxylase
MILVVQAISETDHLAAIHARIALLEWRDGRETAGSTARAVKRNEQAATNSTAGRALQAELADIVMNDAVVRGAAWPRRLSPLLISRTADGGHYGIHVDNALMGRGERRLRTDLSFTLFLTPPADYEGGELVIHTAGMTQEVKAEAGHLVLYPSGALHEVRPVTRGTRIVCVGWIESMIADPARREILFDLENLRASLKGQLSTQSAELLTIDKSIANLLRMWAQP